MPVVTYDDFSGGEYGDLHPYVASKRPGMFTGSNVKVYSDGRIGPRPGLKKVANDGWTTNGVVRGLFFTASDGEELVLTVEGSTSVWRGVVTTTTEALDTFTWTASTGSLSAAPTDWTSFDRYDPTTIYLLNPDDAPYQFVVTGTPTLTKITMPTTSGQGWVLRLWRDRLYIASHDNDTATWRIWYSDAAAFTTVGASNYFDIGYWWPIWSMTPIRNALLFGTQGAGWWTLNGSPITGTLRQIYTRGEPDRPPTVVVDDMERIWFLPQNARPLAVTNGSTWDFDTYEHLYLSGNEHHGDFSYTGRDIMFTTTDGSDEILAQHNDVWVKYDCGVPIDGPITRYSGDYFLICSDGTASTDADFYWFDNSLERPGFASDATAAPGDGSNTPEEAYLHLPYWRHPDLYNVRVRTVTVDFIKYQTGASSPSTNNITCTVDAVYRTAGENVSSSAQSWTEEGSATTTAGEEQRHIFNFGDQGFGGGFQIKFSALRGVKIGSVSVTYDDEVRGSGASRRSGGATR